MPSVLGLLLAVGGVCLGRVSLVAGVVMAVGGVAVLWVLLAKARAEMASAGAAAEAHHEGLRRLHRETECRRAKIEAAGVAQSATLRRASHNMRSPLTSILGLTDALIARTPPGPGRKQLRTVRSSAKHLLDLANELLDMDRAGTRGSASNAANTDPDTLLGEVLDAFAEPAGRRGIALDLSWRGVPPATVYVDPVRLREVLTNLLDNAIRHTHEGSVRVVAEAEPRAGTLTIEITDTGEGIEPSRLAELLDADDTPTRSSLERGTHGLGMAISRHLVAAMRGTVVFASEVGVGTTVTVRVPASPVHSRAEPVVAPPGSARASEGPMRVLVIDDAPEIRDYMHAALAGEGVEAETAASVTEGLGAAASARFEVVFIDQHLGGVEGTSALAELRTTMPSTRFVVLTSDVTPDALRQYRAARFDGVLPKPFEPDQLRDMLARFRPEPAARAA